MTAKAVRACECGYPYNWLYMRLCSACGRAMCPDCCSKQQGALERCRACIDAGHHPKIAVAAADAGYEYARKREEAFINGMLGGGK